MKKWLALVLFLVAGNIYAQETQTVFYEWTQAGKTNLTYGGATQVLTLGTNVVATLQTNTVRGTALILPPGAKEIRFYSTIGPSAPTATNFLSTTLYWVAARKQPDGTVAWDTWFDSPLKCIGTAPGAANTNQVSAVASASGIYAIAPAAQLNQSIATVSNWVAGVGISFKEP